MFSSKWRYVQCSLHTVHILFPAKTPVRKSQDFLLDVKRTCNAEITGRILHVENVINIYKNSVKLMGAPVPAGKAGGVWG
jgi:hypothetical protein